MPKHHSIKLSGKERFESNIMMEPNTGCWLWTGIANTNGYPQMKINGERVLVHRYSYELAYGAIPEGLCVLHRCDTPSCVNPKHLFAGTQQDNMADCKNKGRFARMTGENNGYASLTDEVVLCILKDQRKQIVIAKAYGVSTTNICRIKRREAWKHIVFP